MDRQEKQKFFRLKIISIALMMVFGSCSTLSLSYLDEIGFSFNLFQTILMFGSELLCSSFYFLKCFYKPSTPKHCQTTSCLSSWFKKLGKKGFCVSGVCDFFSTFFVTISYVYMPTFGVMGFKMILILIMSLYRKFGKKRKYYRHQVLGLSLIMIGVMIVTFQLALVESNNWLSNENFLLGLVLMIASQMFLVADIITMEYFMNNYGTEVEVVLAIKGSTGVVVSLLSYVPLHYIIIFNPRNSDIAEAFVFINNHKSNVGYVFLYIISTGVFNYFLIKTLKITDCLAICTVDCGRMILVWVFSYAIFPDEPFYPLEVVAALILILGLIIYNEVLILPFLGFDKSAYKTLKENSTFKDMRHDSRTWQMTLDSLI